MHKQDDGLLEFLEEYQLGLDVSSALTVSEIISLVKRNQMFGVVECDIKVPDHKKEMFSQMCPIFKNVDIPFEAIGEHMQNFVVEHKLPQKPRRGLIGSMFANKILLATPLLRWYLKHGLEVTEVYQVVEFVPKSCFESFADDVSNARRQGERDPSTAFIAETMKLFGNSGYGRSLTNKEKHLNMRYCDEANVGLVVNDPHFRKLDVVDDDFYKISQTKKMIKMDLPMQIGFLCTNTPNFACFNFISILWTSFLTALI